MDLYGTKLPTSLCQCCEHHSKSLLPNCRIIIVPPRFNALIVTFSSRAGDYLPVKFTSIETSATCFSPPPLSLPMETYVLYRIDVICARPIGLVQAWI